MFKFAIPAVAALGLIAYAAQSQATISEAAVGAAPMGWHLSHEGEVAKLAYGVENSDQLALMMVCAPGDPSVIVYGDVLPETPRLRHASTTAAAIDPLSGALAEEARMSLRDPAIRDLVRDGQLAVVGDSGRFQLPATRQERLLIREFFTHCGSGGM